MGKKERIKSRLPLPPPSAGSILTPGLQQIQIPRKHVDQWRRIEKAERAVGACMIAAEHAADYVASLKQGFIEMVRRERVEEASTSKKIDDLENRAKDLEQILKKKKKEQL